MAIKHKFKKDDKVVVHIKYPGDLNKYNIGDTGTIINMERFCGFNCYEVEMFDGQRYFTGVYGELIFNKIKKNG